MISWWVVRGANCFQDLPQSYTNPLLLRKNIMVHTMGRKSFNLFKCPQGKNSGKNSYKVTFHGYSWLIHKDCAFFLMPGIFSVQSLYHRAFFWSKNLPKRLGGFCLVHCSISWVLVNFDIWTWKSLTKKKTHHSKYFPFRGTCGYSTMDM